MSETHSSPSKKEQRVNASRERAAERIADKVLQAVGIEGTSGIIVKAGRFGVMRTFGTPDFYARVQDIIRADGHDVSMSVYRHDHPLGENLKDIIAVTHIDGRDIPLDEGIQNSLDGPFKNIGTVFPSPEVAELEVVRHTSDKQ